MVLGTSNCGGVSEAFPTVQTFSVQTRGVVRGLDSVHRFIGVFHGLAHKIIFGGLENFFFEGFPKPNQLPELPSARRHFL